MHACAHFPKQIDIIQIHAYDFAFHKGAFRDALCLRYGWQPKLLTSTCACGKTFILNIFY